MQLNPDAAFDCLFVADHLARDRGIVPKGEIHLFGYLACLLWLYRRNPLADWGYSFVGTELGSPFSLDIDGAIREFQERGYLVGVQDQLRMSEMARQPLEEFLNLSFNTERGECLRAACSSTAAFSVGMVATALAQEPDLKRARNLPNTRVLLGEAAQFQLYKQFDALYRALNVENIDLRVPAVVWLAALYKSQELAEA
jgi:hypothetical protein